MRIAIRTYVVWAVVSVVVLWLGLAWCSKKRQEDSRNNRLAGYNSGNICGTDFDTNLDFSNSKASHFSVPLKTGCFSVWVTVPSWWKDWHVQPSGDGNAFWIAYWFVNDHYPIGPYYSSDQYSFNKPIHDAFRLQGNGTAVFFTNARGAKAAERGDDQPTENVQPAPIPKLGYLQVYEGDGHICNKPDDVVYEENGFYPPFRFDIHQNNFDGTAKGVNWSDGFKGKVPVCYIVDDKGNPVNIHLLQSLGNPALEKRIVDVVGGWRYQPATIRQQVVKMQMLMIFEFN